MLNNIKEGRVWQATYYIAYNLKYEADYAQKLQEWGDEKEVHYIAHHNADAFAKDVADAVLSEYRAERH